MVNGTRARDRARVSVCASALASVRLRENHLHPWRERLATHPMRACACARTTSHLPFLSTIQKPKVVILNKAWSEELNSSNNYTAGGTNRSSRSNSEQNEQLNSSNSLGNSNSASRPSGKTRPSSSFAPPKKMNPPLFTE